MVDLNRTDNLKIMFWNIRGIASKNDELCKILEAFDICICVESWLRDVNGKIKLNFPGFNIFRKDREYTRGGGIIFLIRKNIAFKEINDLISPHQHLEIASIKITNTKTPLNLIACYKPPRISLTQYEWDRLLENCTFYDNVVMVGDFNAHNVAWNCSSNKVDGSRLLNSINKYNLFVHNINTITHFDVNSGSTSNIDLIISPINVASQLEVKVQDDLHGSDHYPLSLTLNVEKSIYIKKTFRLRSLRTDWEKFLLRLDEGYTDFLNPAYDELPTLVKYSKLVDTITNAVKQITPKKKNCVSQCAP